VTQDAGGTWAAPPSPPWSNGVYLAIAPTLGNVGDLLALSEAVGATCATTTSTGTTTIYSGSNDGLSWNQVGTALEPGLVYYGVPSSQMLLVPTCGGTNNLPLVSSDGGQHWTPIPSWPSALLDRTGQLHQSFDVAGPSAAFALTSDPAARVTTYYVSTDGGATFSAVNTTGGGPGPTSAATTYPAPSPSTGPSPTHT
jgi:hypothetical protein